MSAPSPQIQRWADLAAERARRDAAEDAADAAGNEAEADAQQQLRYLAEDKLMAMPAPDGAGLALKVLIAIGQDPASIPYQKEIEADAVRLAADATNAVEQCNRCRFWHEQESERDPDAPNWGFGHCRREPPRVSEACVAAFMPKLEYGQQADPEIDTVRMTQASLFPATCSTDWCGHFAPSRPAHPNGLPCRSACKKDPLSGVIGVQKGPLISMV